MKFTIKIRKDGSGYTAEGIISSRSYEVYGPNLHSCLRGVANLAEDVGRQRVPHTPFEEYKPIVCHDW